MVIEIGGKTVFSFRKQEKWNNEALPDEPDRSVQSADRAEERETAETDGAETEFRASVEALSDEDIAPKGAKVRRHSTGWYVNRCLVAVCVCVLAVCLMQMLMMLRGYRQADDIYNSLSNEFYAGLNRNEHAVAPLPSNASPSASLSYDEALRKSGLTEDPIKADVSYNVEFELLRANLQNLKRKNSDLFGWISIDGTAIDYPVMQGTDNEYYLGHAYTGDPVPAGAIFADFTNSRNILENRNLCMYGHNMTNGKMFNNLSKFMDADFFAQHQYIVITTLDGIFTYQVFAAYQTSMEYYYIKTAFSDDLEFLQWANEMKSNSQNQREGVTFDEHDRVLTLSTCVESGGYWKSRYTVQAKLVKIELSPN